MSPSCPQISCAGSTDGTYIDTHRCGCPRIQKPPPVPTKLPFAAHREKQIKTVGISTGLVLIEHVQHLRTSAATHDARTTTQTHGRPWRRPSGPPTTRQSQSLCIGRRKSKPGWTAMCDSVWSSLSALATQWHTATWWSYAKKNWKPRRTVDMQSLNANATRETHHTRSIRPDRYLQAWRKLSLMPGMATTASLYIRTTDTWPLSSHHGGDTAIESHLKVMLLLVTAIHGASTKLPQTYRTNLSASMTLSFGQRT